ncbi:MAG: peptidoglycan-binding domain-containing protein [Candidatus Competibacteraceae bacterium]
MATANRMIRQGSTGPDVKLLQGLLNQKVPVMKLPQGKKLVEDGIFGPKTDAAVRTFQQLNTGLKVDGIVGPKTWAALGVTYTGPGAMPPAGKPLFEQKKPKDGFDGTVSPPWQMVPVNDDKTVILKNADGLSVISRNPAIATVEDVPKCFLHGGRELIIRGKMKGTTFIDVKNGAQILAMLEVAVKNKKTVRITFNFVEDKVGHKTTRSMGDVDTWVKNANTLLTLQANVEVIKQNVRNVKIDQDLGPVVRYSKHLPGVNPKEHEWDVVVAKRDNTADLNVFFVWEYEQDATPEIDDSADAATAGGNCLFEDNITYQTHETLAHEIGHHLGVDHPAPGLDLLMSPHRTDHRISKEHANIMNP